MSIDPTVAANSGFLIVCSALVFIMTPGVGLLYSGLSRSKNALTIIMICFLSYAVVSVQWVLFGFSLTFSETGSAMFGNFEFAGFRNIIGEGLPLTAPTVPTIVYALYQLQFATVTVALIFGSVVERIRILPSIVFMFIWTTVIYDPVAYWTWSARGWIRNMSCLSTTAIGQVPCQIGGLDYAGGGPVHMCSGAAALALCIFVGQRKRAGHDAFRPHNITNIFIATGLLWMGWFGFNAGSASAANTRAAYAAFVTCISASSGALSWVMFDYFRTKKMSGIAFCSGAIAGLVGITPGSGYVNAWSAIIIGAITGVLCAMAIHVKDILGYDDSTDAFGVHGVGGFVGSILTGFFASKEIMALDGTVNPGGGLIDGNWVLLGYNLAASVSILAYSFIGTFTILYIVNIIPGLHFRQTEKEELLGGDHFEMGEIAYEFLRVEGTAQTFNTLKVNAESEKPAIIVM